MRMRICAAVTLVATLAIAGCGGLSGYVPFYLAGAPAADSGSTTPTGSGSGSFGSSTRTNADPCTLSTEQKFVTITMENFDVDDYIHYFFVAIAYINGSVYTNGAVCEEDTQLYFDAGYFEVPAGQARDFGNLCIRGPALVYFHESGRFRSGTGTGDDTLASAIAPAPGANTPAFDNFFTSSGARLPVPNEIYFYNPGTGDGQALKISRNGSNPCTAVTQVAQCPQDAFYYVDETDQRVGGRDPTAAGAGVHTANQVQGTGCECGFGDLGFQALAPSNATGSSVQCNEFTRGGTIIYAFVRIDANPPFPQLVWRVTDGAGGQVHDFDPRANIP